MDNSKVSDDRIRVSQHSAFVRTILSQVLRLVNNFPESLIAIERLWEINDERNWCSLYKGRIPQNGRGGGENRLQCGVADHRRNRDSV